MTNKEIEKYIKKNIIGKVGNNLMQKGTYLLIYPYCDILGGFCLEPSVTDKNAIYIWWFVQPLFIQDSMLNLTFGNRLEHLNHNQSWGSLNATETIEEIQEIIRTHISFVESLTEPNLFYKYFNKCNIDNIRIYEALVYVLIWIESSNWKQEAQEFIDMIDHKFDTSISWIMEIKVDMINIKLSDNPKSILEDRKWNLIKLLNIPATASCAVNRIP